MKKLLGIDNIETVANRIKRIMLVDNNPALIVKDLVTLLGLIDELKKENEVTIKDVRKSISSIYQWMTSNSDFNYIKLSQDCSSEDCVQLRYELDIFTKKSTRELGQLTESIDDLDALIRQLKLSIEKEKAIRKKAKGEERIKKKALFKDAS